MESNSQFNYTIDNIITLKFEDNKFNQTDYRYFQIGFSVFANTNIIAKNIGWSRSGVSFTPIYDSFEMTSSVMNYTSVITLPQFQVLGSPFYIRFTIEANTTSPGDLISTNFRFNKTGNTTSSGTNFVNGVQVQGQILDITPPVNNGGFYSRTFFPGSPQTITNFDDIYKTISDAPFELDAKTDEPFATFTYTSSNTAVAEIINDNQVQINGAGVTTLTATASATNNFLETQKTATLTVSVPSLPGWKRSKLNLYDFATKSLHFHIDQATSSTQFNFPTNLNFVDDSSNESILDVIDHLERVESVESDIDLLEGRASVNEADIDLLEGRVSVTEDDIDALEGRASVNEADLVVLKNRADSNASRLQVDDSELSALEAYVDALEGRVSVAEDDIDLLEGRASVNEADLVVLKNRADSNASRLQVDDSELSALEAYVDALEGRMSVAEDDIDLLEGRASINEADLVVLDARTDSNASRLQVDDSELTAIEGYVDALEGRMSTAEADIVDLENSFTVYEADVVEIKGTLYAITDGNIESMLSSLQQITDSFASETNATEDLVELNERLTELISVVQELTEESI
jgi:predicted  nucleic acid-binding Zn-ribbon protein